MSLLEDLKAVVSGEENISEDELAHAVTAKVEQDEVYDTGHRWYDLWQIVFSRGHDFVRGTYAVGSTEMQEDTERNWSFEQVKPVPKTVIVYEPV